MRTLAARLLPLALAAGCTATFTYNHLDWLIPWYVDGYVDLTRDQRKNLEDRLEPLLEWHRDEELVRYIALLDRLEADLNGTVSATTVQAWIDEIEAAAARTEATMLDLALDFGATMNDAQIAELIDSLWERQREYEEEYLPRSDAEYRKDSLDNLADFLERFTGRLSKSQEQRLLEASAALQRFDRAWLEERSRWLTQLEGLLQREAGWQQAVRDGYFARREQRTPEYREIRTHNLALITAAVADVLNAASEKQRQRAEAEIERIRARLRKLTLAAAPDQPRSGTWTHHAAMAEGKALTLYERQQDGSWKIAHDCYSSSVPAESNR